MCFALLRQFNNMTFPYGNQAINFREYSMKITKPITGKYFECLKMNNKCFHNTMTNSRGIVVFKGIRISRAGTNYDNENLVGIKFICGNAESDLLFVKIVTSINNVETI